LQFLYGHACVSEDAAKRSLGEVATGMDRHRGAATVAVPPVTGHAAAAAE
jgi:hypothetical protein